jgi:hypothetical protein
VEAVRAVRDRHRSGRNAEIKRPEHAAKELALDAQRMSGAGEKKGRQDQRLAAPDALLLGDAAYWHQPQRAAPPSKTVDLDQALADHPSSARVQCGRSPRRMRSAAARVGAADHLNRHVLIRRSQMLQRQPASANAKIVRVLTTITAEPAKSQPSTASMTSPFC